MAGKNGSPQKAAKREMMYDMMPGLLEGVLNEEVNENPAAPNIITATRILIFQKDQVYQLWRYAKAISRNHKGKYEP